MRPRFCTLAGVLPVALSVFFAASLCAQDATPPPAAPPAASDPSELDPAKPEFSLVTLPTTLEIPRNRFATRITHRFTRALGQGDFGDLVGDFFGFDSSALVGLELRFGLLTGTQVGIYRTSNKTIEFFAQQQILTQGTGPLALAVKASVEGLDNFGEEYSPHVAVILSHKFGTRAALYVEPSWTGNTNLGLERPDVDENSLALGLGARLRLGEGTYLVGEISPRLGGYKPLRGDGSSSAPLTSFGLERVVGGHSFQINFSNAFGTTPAQVARGQFGLADDWYIGFNIARKFY